MAALRATLPCFSPSPLLPSPQLELNFSPQHGTMNTTQTPPRRESLQYPSSFLGRRLPESPAKRTHCSFVLQRNTRRSRSVTSRARRRSHCSATASPKRETRSLVPEQQPGAVFRVGGSAALRNVRPVACHAEGNGAAYGSVAVVDARVRANALKERKFVCHVEGGGQVKATVSSSGQEMSVQLDVSMESPKYDSARPLLLHWGIHRSDCTSWFTLEPNEAPKGTEFVELQEGEAMRTPFKSLGEGMMVGKAKGQTVATSLSLALQFKAALAPFSLNFVLFQPADAYNQEVYIGGTSFPSFSVPVGMDKGSPEPLGATRLPDGSLNFALFSKHAEQVVLCLYESLATEPTMEIDLARACHKTGDVWHVRVLDSGPFSKYGYRCKGDVAWDSGNRFHSRAVLLDPYAKILAPPVSGQELLPSPAAALGAIPPMDEDEFEWEEDFQLRIPQEQLVVYRLNVGAFTIESSSGVPNTERGTFLGVARKASYLHSLGVNAVLLQPVTAFDEAQGSYFPFSFFAPMPAYGVGADPALAARDMKFLVRELHKWGIEVLVEVVVSHTAERSDLEPTTISFRGIDNKTYYIIDENGSQVVPMYGAPNAFNCNHPTAQTLIVDALTHWVTEYHIDGFSFVNIQALLTGPHGQPVARPLLVEALSFYPTLSSSKLIADPCSPITGSCEVGQLPHWWRWIELNNRFCSDVRRFLKGDKGTLSAMATRLSGSGDMFSSGRGPAFGLNYVTGFVGLTLADLVSYTNASENSWGSGVDGPTEDAFVSATRLRQVKNFICALFFSLGSPVLVMGDEYGHTKGGMLNMQDWDGVFLWPNLETELAQQLTRFVSALAAIRRRHRSLVRDEYWFAGDITWHGVKAYEQPQWGNPESSFLAYSVQRLSSPAVAAPEAEAAPGVPESALYVAFNAQPYAVQLDLPATPPQCTWFRIVDTSADHPEDTSAVPLERNTFDLQCFSVLALEARIIDVIEA